MSGRAPSGYDVPVCTECRRPIKAGAPKVTRGAAWICQACAYELDMSRSQSPRGNVYPLPRKSPGAV